MPDERITPATRVRVQGQTLSSDRFVAYDLSLVSSGSSRERPVGTRATGAALFGGGSPHETLRDKRLASQFGPAPDGRAAAALCLAHLPRAARDRRSFIKTKGVSTSPCIRSIEKLSEIAQVSTTYGKGVADTIVENCGNTLILRCSASEQG
jgi:hypothetical protein